jgi:hypothetical protein
MPTIESPNISANAGDEKVLSDPNSPEAISRRAQKAEAQTAEDQRYDPPPPTRVTGFQDFHAIMEDTTETQKTIYGLFLALATILFLYKGAPDPR